MKAETGAEGRRLYTCLTVYATEGTQEELKEKSQLFYSCWTASAGMWPTCPYTS